jgi:hypothetical protein
MSSTMNFDVTVDSGIIEIFQRENFKLERVFSEFVDNSLQSFLDHQDELKIMPSGGKCIVNILWNDESILITDNAYGMNEEEFGRALKLKATNPNALKSNQLSVYGMGLKYAAVYLGNHYAIDSTAFGSKINYHAEIDVPEFASKNPKTVKAALSDAFPDDHQTKIQITSLRVKRTPQKILDLRQKLGTIYNHYISKGILTIIVNNIPVHFKMPELRSGDDGQPYYRNFDDSFTAAGKTYKFTGWIAILKKGDQAITGLNLIQANRCIELGYKPHDLFGKGNSFQNSRVIGEVVFEGENYILSFNKDKFVWVDDGAEDAFLNSLKNNPNIQYIKHQAIKLRKTEDADAMAKKTEDNLHKKGVAGIKVVEKEAGAEPSVEAKPKESASPAAVAPNATPSEKIPDDGASAKTVPEVTPADTVSTVQKADDEMTPESHEGEDKPKKYLKCQTIVSGKETNLYVDVCEGEANGDWMRLEQLNGDWILHVNYKNKFIVDNFGNQNSKVGANSLAILIATAVLKAQESGLKLVNAVAFLNTLNKMMGDSGKDE